MSNVIKPVLPGVAPYATDVDQFRQILSGTADVGTIALAGTQSSPSVPAVSAGSAGVLNGTYRYKIVKATGWKENNGTIWVNGFAPSVTTGSVITVSSSKVVVTVPALADPVVAYLIYRSPASGANGSEKFLAAVTNGSLSFVDNISDSSLGTGMPTWKGTAVPAAMPTVNTSGTTLAPLTTHISDAVKHVTSTERTNWNSVVSGKGAANGIATLDAGANVPASQLGNVISSISGSTRVWEYLATQTFSSDTQEFSFISLPVYKRYKIEITGYTGNSSQFLRVSVNNVGNYYYTRVRNDVTLTSPTTFTSLSYWAMPNGLGTFGYSAFTEIEIYKPDYGTITLMQGRSYSYYNFFDVAGKVTLTEPITSITLYATDKFDSISKVVLYGSQT